jgi:urocanate hydratase
MGVIRHADAGYEKARRVAEERGLDMPSIQTADNAEAR